MGSSETQAQYYPPPESAGGWRMAEDAHSARKLAGLDLDKLAPARAWNAGFGVPSSVVIIRHGYMVADWCENGSEPATRFNIYSCTKSFTGTAYGIMFEDARHGRLPGVAAVDLDSHAYAYIPEGYPLTDPRKQRVTLHHLLSMSSGIPGESIGIFGLPTAPGVNPLDAALGHCPFRSERVRADLWALYIRSQSAAHQVPSRSERVPGDLWVSQLAAEPGEQWDYSDPAFVHLSLALAHIMGLEMGDFMRERVFDPLGIEALSWDTVGIDDGHTGLHTKAISGVHISARELARFGYLMACGGAWNQKQIVPPWWIELATRSSQASNPGYGLTWWTNTGGALWDGVPHDAFSAMGYNANFCCIIPSLDLVVVRIGAGPSDPVAEVIAEPFLAAVVAAVVDA